MQFLFNLAGIKYSIISCITLFTFLTLTLFNPAFSSVASPDENASIALSETNSTNSTNSSLLPSSILSNASTLDLNLSLSNSTLGLINTTPLSEQFANMDNLTNVTGTDGSFVNDTQLSGTENVTLIANFSSKPVGLDTDYMIVGKPLVLVNDVPLTYEFLNDTSDEITVTDILISMRVYS